MKIEITIAKESDITIAYPYGSYLEGVVICNDTGKRVSFGGGGGRFTIVAKRSKLWRLLPWVK